MPFKGTVSRDFLYPVFFINQFILVPLEMSMDRFYFLLLFHRVIALFKTTPRYFGNRGVATPRYFGYRGVATPRFPKYRGVVTFLP